MPTTPPGSSTSGAARSRVAAAVPNRQAMKASDLLVAPCRRHYSALRESPLSLRASSPLEEAISAAS